MYELLTFARLDVASLSPPLPFPHHEPVPVIRREGIKRESPCRSLAFSPWGFEYLFKYRGVAPRSPPLPSTRGGLLTSRSNRSCVSTPFFSSLPSSSSFRLGIFVFSTRERARPLTWFIRWLLPPFRILCCRREEGGGGGGGVGRFKEMVSRSSRRRGEGWR